MTRVLIITTEVLPFFPFPSRGGGIRAQMFFEGLKDAGFEPIYGICGDEVDRLKPYANKDIYFFTPEESSSMLAELKPDAILSISWFPLIFLPLKMDIPVIVDFHGATLIENNYKNIVDFRWDFFLKVRALTKADYFISSSMPGSDMYFYPYLFASGIEPKEVRIDYIPVSFEGTFPIIRKPATDKTHFIYSGVLWQWKDSFDYLRLVADYCTKHSCGDVTVFADNLKPDNGITVLSPTNRGNILEAYSRSDIGINLMRIDNETRRGVTTVALEMMWAGLPVIALENLQINSLIREYKAGWLIDPNDTSSLYSALDEIRQNPMEIRARGESASRLVHEHFLRRDALKPLISFLHAPYKLKRGKPLLHSEALIRAIESEIGGIEQGTEVAWRRLDDLNLILDNLNASVEGREKKIKKIEERIAFVKHLLPSRIYRLVMRNLRRFGFK